jgi:hypothetical protein
MGSTLESTSATLLESTRFCLAQSRPVNLRPALRDLSPSSWARGLAPDFEAVAETRAYSFSGIDMDHTDETTSMGRILRSIRAGMGKRRT